MYSHEALSYLIPFTSISIVGTTIMFGLLLYWRKNIQLPYTLHYGFCWILLSNIINLCQYFVFQIIRYTQVNIKASQKTMEVICYFWTFFIHVEIVLPLYVHCVMLIEQFTGFLSSNLRNTRSKVVCIFTIVTLVIVGLDIFLILYQKDRQIMFCFSDPRTIKMISIIQLVWWFMLPGVTTVVMLFFISMKLILNHFWFKKLRNREMRISLLLITLSFVRIATCIPILSVHITKAKKIGDASQRELIGSDVNSFLFRMGGFLDWLIIFLFENRLRLVLWAALKALFPKEKDVKPSASGDVAAIDDKVSA